MTEAELDAALNQVTDQQLAELLEEVLLNSPLVPEFIDELDDIESCDDELQHSNINIYRGFDLSFLSMTTGLEVDILTRIIDINRILVHSQLNGDCLKIAMEAIGRNYPQRRFPLLTQ